MPAALVSRFLRAPAAGVWLGPLWRRLRPLGPPPTSLARLRWLFLLCSLLLLTGSGSIMFASPLSLPVRLPSLVGLVALALVRVAGYRRGDFTWRDHVFENGALALVLTATRATEPSSGAIYSGVFLLSLYGSTRRALVQACAYVGLLALAPLVFDDGQVAGLGPTLATRGVAIFVLSALMNMLASTMSRHQRTLSQLERTLGREQALTRAGALFAAAGDRQQVYAAAVQVAVDLVPDDATCRAVLSIGSAEAGMTVVAAAGGDAEGLVGRVININQFNDQRHVAGRAFDGNELDLAQRERVLGFKVKPGGTFVAPLTPHGSVRGLLALSSDHPLPPECQSSLDQLGVATGLALESLAAFEESLRQKDERLQALVQHSSDVVSILDAQGRIEYLSPSVERVFGHAAAALIGQRLVDVVHPDDVPTVQATLASLGGNDSSEALLECRVRHSDGSWRDTESRVTNLLGEPAIQGIVLNMRDVTERKMLEARLVEQAFRDPLTGLANRALFNDRAAQALARRERTGQGVGLLLLDLDNFKAVNDSLGHAAGDALLVETGRRLQTCVRPADTVARLGGDEFAVLLEDVEGPEAITAAAERISRIIRVPLELEATEVVPTASIGVAESRAGEGADALHRNADVALYAAKRQGIGRIESFQPAMHAATFERLALSAALRRAVEREEFVLHYQPVTLLETGRVLGFEALVRWPSPERGLVSPAEFIPLAEETGLIVPLGRLVLHEACAQLGEWRRSNLLTAPLTMSINLSARQLQDPTLVRDIDDALRDNGLRPEDLVVEITESLLLRDTEVAIERLHALKELGVRLALDDFGTGYSSLSYLQRLPMDVLKVDKSFVDRVADCPRQAALTRTILSLGRMLELQTVAEGVEHPDQASTLQQMGCLVGQGYYFGRPLAASETTRLLRRLAAGDGTLPESAAASDGASRLAA